MTTTVPGPRPDEAPVRAAGWAGRWAAGWRRHVTPLFLAALLLVFLVMTPTGIPEDTHGLFDQGGTGYGPLFWAGGASCVAAVALARRAPRWACVLALWPFLSVPATGVVVWGWWLALLMIAAVAAVDRPRSAVLPTLLALGTITACIWLRAVALLPIGPVWFSPYDMPRYADYVFEVQGDAMLREHVDEHVVVTVAYVAWVVAVLGTALAVGYVRRARARTRAAAAAQEEASRATQVTAVRARVAHDLHDVVAHHVSLVAVRAESAPYLHPGMDPASREVMAQIAGDAREALGELRQVLAVLQRAEDAAGGAVGAAPDAATGDGAPAGAPLRPQPGATDVADLVAVARDAGQDVRLDAAPAALAAVPAGAGYVVYRVVQEALTNARRHAPGRPVEVRVDLVPGTPGTSDDAGPAVVVHAANAVPADGPAGAPGRGLTGMRERVEALGGTLGTGVRDGRFVVEARLPLGAATGAGVTGPVDGSTAEGAR